MGVGEVDEILTLLCAFINTAGSVSPEDSTDQIPNLCVSLTSIMVNLRVVILEKASSCLEDTNVVLLILCVEVTLALCDCCAQSSHL